MKKFLVTVAVATLISPLSACGKSADTQSRVEPSATISQSQEVPDLAGTWKQTNSESEDAYQQAEITADTITVNWITDGGDSEALYWVGTFVPPEDNGKYVFTSEGDVEKMNIALLASTDSTKEFTYEDGVISYKVGMMGTTTTVRLEKQK